MSSEATEAVVYGQFAVYYTRGIKEASFIPLITPRTSSISNDVVESDSVSGRSLFTVYFTTLFYLARNIPPDSSAAAPEQRGAQPEGMKAVHRPPLLAYTH